MEQQIYVIGRPNDSVAKIGLSANPQRRLMELKGTMPGPLEVRWTCYGGYALEKHLHGLFAQYRTVGEWFDFEGADPVASVRDAVHLIARSDLRSLVTVSPFPESEPDCRCRHPYKDHELRVPRACTVFFGPDEWMGCRCEAYAPNPDPTKTAPPPAQARSGDDTTR